MKRIKENKKEKIDVDARWSMVRKKKTRVIGLLGKVNPTCAKHDSFHIKFQNDILFSAKNVAMEFNFKVNKSTYIICDAWM